MKAHCGLTTAGLFILGVLLATTSFAAEPLPISSGSEQGEELFTRVWQAGDARSPAGDGLGPLFNDVSCVACHHQGGTGGGGANGKNILLLTAFDDTELPHAATDQQRLLSSTLTELHPAFAKTRTVLVHLHGSIQFEKWRENLLPAERFDLEPNQFSVPRFRGGGGWGGGQAVPIPRILKINPQPKPKKLAQGNLAERINARFDQQILSTRDHFQLSMTMRNSTALFGSGRIDEIPEEVIRSAAQRTSARFPEISGRVSELAGGRIGRFGWKAQIASLEDFVLTACANELGLQVPHHRQPISPVDPGYRPPGHDLSPQSCSALVQFVRQLPEPVVTRTRAYAAGEVIFNSIGCSECHIPRLGDVAGIYSDLLLHDMGPQLSAAGFYDSFVPASTNELVLQGGFNDREAQIVFRNLTRARGDDANEPAAVGPSNREWRTPPLWGVRDSAPYLHDGRAATLDEAILMHAGEAEKVAQKYRRLSESKQRELREFLQSLVAPYPRKVYTSVAARD